MEIFIAANNLQPVRKSLLCKSSLLNIFKNILNMLGILVATQKVSLKKDHIRDSERGSHLGA